MNLEWINGNYDCTTYKKAIINEDEININKKLEWKNRNINKLIEEINPYKRVEQEHSYARRTRSHWDRQRGRERWKERDQRAAAVMKYALAYLKDITTWLRLV